MARITARYFNRELSWLEFNQRVLEEAADSHIPLLERLKFLAITASNLDEFFRVRVGSLQTLASEGVTLADPSGMQPLQQLVAIRRRVRQMTDDQYRLYREELEPALSAAGIRRLRPNELNAGQKRVLKQVFEDELFSVLTPMAVTAGEEFPLLVNQMLNVCVRLQHRQNDPDKVPLFAVIPLGWTLSRFITLPTESGYGYVLLEDVVAQSVEQFFLGHAVLECIPFRITRSADVSVEEDNAADFLAEMKQVLKERRSSHCVRLEIVEQASPEMLAFLRQALDVESDGVYTLPSPLDLSAFFRLSERPGFDNLRYESWPPLASPEFPPGTKIFDVIATQDVLLYHPYESFDPVVQMIQEAAEDPDVLAIKQTLYRTSRNSPIVAALLKAASRGKHVTVVVELKARFDEARNIEWAQQLEHAGAQVIYGVKGYKTHSKVCIIVRREPHGIQRYVHFGTGNYNEITSKIYSDASLLTSNVDLGADAITFFNSITGYSQPHGYREIASAPLGMREKLLEMIRAETTLAKEGRKARIVAKVNSLVDSELIDALYEASQAGVEIKLNIRGICCLRPGVKGMSEKIEVVSIVDRFLEHARVMFFLHGGDERVFISSADWMPRNLDRRVELLVPVEDPKCRDRLIHILDTYFVDTVKARKLTMNGQYKRSKPGADPLRSQQVLYEEARQKLKLAEHQRQTTFEAHEAG